MALDLTRRQLLAGATALSGVALLSACETNRATGRQSFTGFYSMEDDIALGREEHPKLIEQFGGAYEDPKLNAYVQALGGKLAKGTEMPDLNYTFTIVNSPLANAFALPGGYIYLTRGLLPLASNEAELAGVLSHELGHVNARHTAERLSRATVAQVGIIGLSILGAVFGIPGDAVRLVDYGARAYIQGYSQEQEFEGDMLGVRYMSKAGYDSTAMVSFLSALREQSLIDAKIRGLPEGSVDEYNVMATHPRTIDRVQKAVTAVEAQRPAQPRVDRHSFLNAIDGMLFGDDPKQGIIFGRDFKHPILRFAFTVPEGFRLKNSDKFVLAQHPNGSIIALDGQKLEKSGQSMPDYLDNVWAKKTRLKGVESLTINGLDAATGITQVTRNGVKTDVRLVAIRHSPDQIYRFQFFTPTNVSAVMRAGLQRTTYSFRKLSAKEAGAIKPLRLRVTVSRRGDTVEGLSAGMPYGNYNADYFRLFNDMKPGEALSPGRRIKVVGT